MKGRTVTWADFSEDFDPEYIVVAVIVSFLGPLTWAAALIALLVWFSIFAFKTTCWIALRAFGFHVEPFRKFTKVLDND